MWGRLCGWREEEEPEESNEEDRGDDKGNIGGFRSWLHGEVIRG